MIEWYAETGFKLLLGRARLTPTDCSAALLFLRLAKITRIFVSSRYDDEDDDEDEPPSFESHQKWIKACIALKRESILTV
jgi:hypothetical protein